MGFVAGAESKGEMNGYVGGKPVKRESPTQRPQAQRRIMPNLASPDPALANSAFTESQFTTNISAAAMQSASMREATDNTDSAEAEDPRLANLRKYKQSTGARGGGGFSPYPGMRPTRSQNNGRGTLREQERAELSTNGIQSVPEQETRPPPASSFVAYTLSDPGSMYKAFSGGQYLVSSYSAHCARGQKGEKDLCLIHVGRQKK